MCIPSDAGQNKSKSGKVIFLTTQTGWTVLWHSQPQKGVKSPNISPQNYVLQLLPYLNILVTRTQEMLGGENIS